MPGSFSFDWRHATSGLNISAWQSELKNDSDKDFLMKGLKEGFDIIEPNAVLTEVCVQNHKSALKPDARIIMDKLIYDEICKGNYLIADNNSMPVIISALGAVPKSDGGLRPIHDGSLPVDTGMNAYSVNFDHYSYESVDDAIAMMKENYYAAKLDISQAYRHIGINKQSQKATGLKWTFMGGQTVVLYDTKLPFGSRASPTIFHRISQAIKRMMIRRGYEDIVAYQDDFLVSASTHARCLEAWETLKKLLTDLGLKINHKKSVPPATSLVFLGIQIDSVRRKMSLPVEKLNIIQDCVAEFAVKKRATKQQLQSLAGRLNFASKVVRGGRLFLRRLFDVIARLKHRHHKVRLNGMVKEDIMWWHTFLADFNGVAAFMDHTPITTVLTDACLKAGGAFYNGDLFYTVWQEDYPQIADACINYKEAMIAVLALQRWGHLFANKFVFLYTDNQCAVSILNKCSCKNETLMQCMKDMFWVSAKYNFVVKAIYMQGCLQVIPDAISRLHEHSGLLRVHKLINDWYMCHVLVENMFDFFNLLNHMSMHSMFHLLDQIMAWRKVKFR